MVHKMETSEHIDTHTIYSIADILYNSFNTSEEIIRIATSMVNLVQCNNTGTYFERGIISTLSFFIDNEFLVATDTKGLDAGNLIPSVPQLWQNRIVYFIPLQHAKFYIKKKNQQFRLTFTTFTSNEAPNAVQINLCHCGNGRTFDLSLTSSELNELTNADNDQAIALAVHIAKKLAKVMGPAIKRATNNQAPSTPGSPV